MDEKALNNYKFDIGQSVWQYINNEDQYEIAEVVDRKISENGHKMYKTNIINSWENETFLSAILPSVKL